MITWKKLIIKYIFSYCPELPQWPKIENPCWNWAEALPVSEGIDNLNKIIKGISFALILPDLLSIILLHYTFDLVCKPNIAIKPADGATNVWIFGERHNILLYLKKDGWKGCLLFNVKHTIKEFLKWFWIDFTMLLS